MIDRVKGAQPFGIGEFIKKNVASFLVGKTTCVAIARA